MRSKHITFRMAPEIFEEIARLSHAFRKSNSEVVRILVEEALAHRAEEMTASQFQLVENRLSHIEKRFSGWMVKLARAIAEALFYSEQLATFDLEENDKKRVNDAAAKFVRRFIQLKHEEPANNPEPT